MKLRLPIGTEITPISSVNGNSGVPVMTTILVDFEEADILKRMKRTIEGEEIEFASLSLGDNPSQYDSYIFKTSDIGTNLRV